MFIIFGVASFGVVQGFCDRFKGELIRQEGATKEVEPIYVKKKFYRIDTKEEGQVVNIIVDKVSGKTRVVVPGRKDGLAAPSIVEEVREGIIFPRVYL